MYVGDERCHFFSVGAGDSVGAPGVMKAFLRGESEEGGSPSLQPIDGLSVPEFVDRRARPEVRREDPLFPIQPRGQADRHHRQVGG
jgi:hypothetical protein